MTDSPSPSPGQTGRSPSPEEASPGPGPSPAETSPGPPTGDEFGPSGDEPPAGSQQPPLEENDFGTLLPDFNFDSNAPRGEAGQVAEEYFEWLHAHYLTRHPNAEGQAPPQWDVFWTGPFLQALALGAVFILFFAVFARYFNTIHRAKSAYEVTRYAAITERHGKFGVFNWTASIAVVAWAFYYAIDHMLNGQVY